MIRRLPSHRKHNTWLPLAVRALLWLLLLPLSPSLVCGGPASAARAGQEEEKAGQEEEGSGQEEDAGRETEVAAAPRSGRSLPRRTSEVAQELEVFPSHWLRQRVLARSLRPANVVARMWRPSPLLAEPDPPDPEIC